MNALVLHAPVDRSHNAEAWWEQSRRVAMLLPYEAKALVIADVNGRVGSRLSETIGDVHADKKTHNGAFVSSLVATTGTLRFCVQQCGAQGLALLGRRQPVPGIGSTLSVGLLAFVLEPSCRSHSSHFPQEPYVQTEEDKEASHASYCDASTQVNDWQSFSNELQGELAFRLSDTLFCANIT